MAGKINGVDVDRLVETIQAIQETPAIADFQFRAQNKWLDGGHNRSTITDFDGGGSRNNQRPTTFVFDADEPPVLLGMDQAANPVEFVLHALAACLTTSLVYHAAARGIEVQRVETKLEGDLNLHGFLGIDDDVRNGYEEIRVAMTVEAQEDQIEELVELAQRRSPVFDIVTNPVPVRVWATQA
jgi:uncharacterized OsmC-like protein